MSNELQINGHRCPVPHNVNPDKALIDCYLYPREGISGAINILTSPQMTAAIESSMTSYIETCIDNKKGILKRGLWGKIMINQIKETFDDPNINAFMDHKVNRPLAETYPEYESLDAGWLALLSEWGLIGAISRRLSDGMREVKKIYFGSLDIGLMDSNMIERIVDNCAPDSDFTEKYHITRSVINSVKHQIKGAPYNNYQIRTRCPATAIVRKSILWTILANYHLALLGSKERITYSHNSRENKEIYNTLIQSL